MTAAPRITDSHCHLDFADFDGHLDGIVANAATAGVWRMVTICTKLREEPNVRAIADRFENVFYAAGTHPMSVASEPMVTADDLVALADHKKFVAIGETGLDYHYTSESADVQKQSLRLHIEAAQRTNLPLIIHARAADDDMADILTAEYKNAPFSCVMHCFCSGPDLAKAALANDFYLSMSGIATFKNSQQVRDIFAAAPVDRVLVETDAPYLAPTPYRGKRNEPAFTAFTAQVGADVFGLSLDDFAAQTETNFERLFWKTT
ncbi:MAG: TatD family hydrolase [Pseudomonadota bacterium]